VRVMPGRLLPTRAGDAARRDPAVLWQHLAAHLATDKDGRCAEQARLLALLHIASDPEGDHRERVAQALTRLGWRHADGRPFGPEDGWWTEREVDTVLDNVSDRPRRFSDRSPSPAAVALARAALTTGR
jgi:hypothetical protein